MIISATTDGFICDIKDLPEKVDGYFSTLYKKARFNLSGVYTLLELKYIDEIGVLSWCTRGQLGFGSRLIATTGYQISESMELVREKLLKCFQGDKTIRFMQYSLRSGTEICKKGGLVTSKLNEKNFNMKYDNRRCLTEHRTTNGYFISKPYLTEKECIIARGISSMDRVKWSGQIPVSNNTGVNSKDNYLKISVRMLIRYIFENPLVFCLPEVIKRKYIISIMIDLGVNVTPNYISQQKALPFIPHSIPRTLKTIEFFNIVGSKFPLFNSSILLRGNRDK